MMGLDSFDVFHKAAKRGISSSIEARNNNNIKKLQTHKSMKKKMMTMVHHHDNHHRPFPDPPYQFCYSGDGNGPTLCTNTNNTSSSRTKSSNIYDVVFATSDDHPASSASASAAAFGISSPINSEIARIIAFQSPGGMAASLEYPFTIAQWKELERQALIYKYLMASIPVPPDLLFPSIRNPSVPAASHYHFGNGLNLRIPGRGDLEPGRCRRTDGKKWRCSRDVAPDQKYCERHMHRGRPRSRKPVELPKKKPPRHTQTQPLPSSPSTVIAPHSSINPTQSPFLGNISHPLHQNQDFPDELRQKFAGFGSNNPPFTSSFKEPRGLEWMMNRESVSMAPLDHQHWDNLNQNYDQESLSLNSYIDFGKNQEINNCGLFLNHDVVPLEKPVQDPERGFIDLWSSDCQTGNAGIKTGEKQLSLSSLSLSVGDHIHMGLGVTDSDQNPECGSGTRPNGSSWLPGGPLAEVLRPSTAATASKPGANPPTSPSGVLHRTLASMSDSSGSSSPTFASSGVRPEIGLMRLSQGRTVSST